MSAIGLGSLIPSQTVPAPLAAAQAAPLPPIGTLMQPQPAPPATPEAQETLKSGWMQALSRPDIQAGLLQFAMAAFQPPSPGQSSIGHVANAVAKGGAAAGRVQKTERDEAQENERIRLEQERVNNEGKRVGLEGQRVGLEGRRVEEDARSNAAREQIMRDSQASEERRHKETLANSLANSRAQIAAQLKIASGSKDDRLFAAILEDVSGKYTATLRDNTQQRMAINQNPMLTPEQKAAQLAALKDPTPPTTQELMSKFKVFRGVVNNGGSLPDDNTISDQELVDALTSKDPNKQAQGQALLPFTSMAQRSRVTALVQRRANTRQKPASTAN